MPLPSRVVSRTLTLSCALLGSAAPLGCQKIQEWTGGGEKAEDKKTDAPVAVPGAVPGATQPAVAVTPPTVVPAAAATVDSLLALVQADSSEGYMIFRQPDGLLDLGDEIVKFYDGPVVALGAALGAAELATNFAKVKTGLVDVRSKLKDSGVDLSRGLVVTQTGPSSSSAVFLVAAAQPDSIKKLLTALNVPEQPSMVCKSIEAAPGYVGCADSDAVLAAYKPGDASKRRSAAETALPGVTLNDLQVLGFVEEGGGAHIALAMPPGLGVLHVGLPTSADEGRDVAAVLEPGPANMLRFARPGTGFVWFRTDVAEIRRRSPELGSSGQPQIDAAVAAWNGEVFFGGSSDPAAMQLRLGFDDVKAAAGAIEFGGVVGQMGAPKDIPGIPGSKITFETKELTFGAEVAKAIHIGISGVPQADMATQLLGLTPDLWVFAADSSLAIAAGVDATNVVRLTSPAGADATLASLPPALAEDLRANRVGFVMHTPVDALQGPVMSKALDAALKDVPGYKPEQVRSALAMAAPMSSGTLWITENAGQPVVHVALQGIGHTSDEEGKAALAAAVAVAAGGDPAALFGDLAAKYPSSPRLAAYQARAGTTGTGVLAASGVAAASSAPSASSSPSSPSASTPEASPSPPSSWASSAPPASPASSSPASWPPPSPPSASSAPRMWTSPCTASTCCRAACGWACTSARASPGIPGPCRQLPRPAPSPPLSSTSASTTCRRQWMPWKPLAPAFSQPPRRATGATRRPTSRTRTGTCWWWRGRSVPDPWLRRDRWRAWLLAVGRNSRGERWRGSPRHPQVSASPQPARFPSAVGSSPTSCR